MDKPPFDNHLDWVSFTTDYTDAMWEILPPHSAFECVKGIWMNGRYTVASEMENGGQVGFNPERQDLGVMVNLPGQALNEMRKMGYPDDALIDFMVTQSVKATRIDYCQNIHVEGASINDLRMHHELKWNMCCVENVSFREQIQGGEGYTMWIGSEKSPIYIRAYNKGAQMGLLKEAWLRVELQARGKHAKAFVLGAKKRGLKREFISKVKSNYHAPQLKWWVDALDAPDVAPEPTEKSEHKWEKYAESFFKSFMKNLPTHTEFCAELISKMAEAYEREVAYSEK